MDWLSVKRCVITPDLRNIKECKAKSGRQAQNNGSATIPPAAVSCSLRPHPPVQNVGLQVKLVNLSA